MTNSTQDQLEGKTASFHAVRGAGGNLDFDCYMCDRCGEICNVTEDSHLHINCEEALSDAGGVNDKSLRKQISKILVKWSMPTRQAAINELVELVSAAVQEERVRCLECVGKKDDTKCQWCGRTYMEHDMPPYSENTARTPCLLRREGFYPRDPRNEIREKIEKKEAV